MAQGNSVRHKLQFLVNDHVIPYNMTVYQAIRQYSNPTGIFFSIFPLFLFSVFIVLFCADQSETDTESEAPMAHASIWVQTHTIHYRPVPENDANNYASASAGKSASGQSNLLPCGAGGAGGTRKGKGSSSKSAAKKKGDDLWNGESL